MRYKIIISIFLAAFIVTFSITAIVNTTLNDFLLPGSQPNQSGTFELPSKCDNCHGGYDIKVEPAFNWRGNMMAQAARDPLFFASMTIANQDAAFAGDFCIRCHSPKGWLEGRSIPTNGSALTANDREGVLCDFCHRAIKPTPLGVNPYPNEPAYTSGAYIRDQAYLATLSAIPPTSANGMYIIDNKDDMRGPYTDPAAPHKFYYSPFHKESAICGTCHDVSNPVYQKNVDGSGNFYYTLNNLNTPPPSADPYSQFPVERTYSEWLKSAYNTPQGIYAPQFGGNKQYVSTCQDCHMRDLTGKGCNKPGAPVRTDLPHHDFTGGNTWIPKIIPTFFTGTNAAALDSGIRRATYMLQNAAILSVFEDNLFEVRVRVTNQTGHKLPSGYPEGRRMWLNLKAFDADMNLVQEFGAYDSVTALLNTSNTKVYEAKLGMSPEILAATQRTNDPDGSSFHFVLNNLVVKDNRIPPRGFTNSNFKQIQSPPVAAVYADGQFWDETIFNLPVNTVWYEVNLYYQTASKEYIEFLRNKNVTDDWGTRLYNAWAASGKSRPVLMARYVNGDPLPVQIASFSATVIYGSTVKLEWVTISETNNYGFFVQRRHENQHEFSELPDNFIPGHGTTLEPKYYSWEDVPLPPGTYEYRLRQVDNDGLERLTDPVTIVVGSPTYIRVGTELPGEYMLDKNFPNPFNPSTVIRFAIPEETNVKLSIYDLQGRLVTSLIDDPMAPGIYQITWNAIDALGNVPASSLYLLRLETKSFSQTRKMILLR